MLDTLVMANLGYFQLKAAPAVWTLTLAPGRSQQLYAIHSSMDLDAFDRLGSEVCILYTHEEEACIVKLV